MPWPAWDEEVAREGLITLVVQVNGKVRDKLEVPADTDDAALREAALASPRIQEWLDGRTPRQVIVVRGRLVNVVA
jgi:leucyl-tRNA synthetase